jgi:hypothetical protein
MKIVFTACDVGTESSSSGSSSGGSSSFSLKPKTHNSSYGSTCNVQTASQYQAADIRYNQYSECMYTYDGDPQCEGYYDNYLIQVDLAEQTRTSLGC